MTAGQRAGRTVVSPSRLARAAPPLRGCGLDRLPPPRRVEVAVKEVRIMGSKGDLLRTLAAASGVKSATPGVRSSVPSWWAANDDDEHYVYAIAL